MPQRFTASDRRRLARALEDHGYPSIYQGLAWPPCRQGFRTVDVDFGVEEWESDGGVVLAVFADRGVEVRGLQGTASVSPEENTRRGWIRRVAELYVEIAAADDAVDRRPVVEVVEGQVEVEHQVEGQGTLARLEPASPVATIGAATAERLGDLLERGTAENTLRAREGDRRRFWEWVADCYTGAVERYPVEVTMLVTWITECLTGERDPELEARAYNPATPRRYSVATVERTVSTLAMAHDAAGVEGENAARSPIVRETLRAARRIRAREGGQRQAAAVCLGDVRRMVHGCGEDLAGIRDAALLLVLYASGLRRSEVSALELRDLERSVDPKTGELAYALTVRHSKADQEGRGNVVAIVGQAAEALAAWLTTAELEDGPVFRGLFKGGRTLRPGAMTPQAIADVVAGRAAAAGYDHITPHGFRAGFATDASRARVPDADARAGRWRTPAAHSRYTRAVAALDNPAARLTSETAAGR